MPTRTYLELAGPAQVRPAAAAAPAGARLARMGRCTPAFARFLYVEVGRSWRWLDRLPWSDAQWRDHLDRDGVSLWLLTVEASPAGYFELARGEDGAVEIAYFGLLPEFIGGGIGGWLLGEAVARAWDAGASRVWLHTCTLDHPAALPNYLARGFTVVREEAYA
jgi:GNAT superfamily N-acetyltransferase